MRPAAKIRCACCLLAFAAATSAAQAAIAAADDALPYPSRPIRLIVPSAPAGAGDALARETAARLSEALQVGVVVDNRAGASGLVGTEAAAHAAPDGYTLLFATSATHVIAPIVTRAARFDPVTDFEPVIPMGYAMSVILVRGSLPVTTLPELVRYAHARPGKLAYASSGAGSANHLDTEVLATLTGMSLLHVPYRGTADGYRALLANDVQLMIGAITSALPPIRSGDARPLAVMARHRSTLLPDVPTLAEVGVGDADVRKWLGVVAPAGTPRAIVARLNETLDGILRTPSMQAWMRDHGFETGGGPPDEFRRILADDTLKWKAIVSRIEHDTR